MAECRANDPYLAHKPRVAIIADDTHLTPSNNLEERPSSQNCPYFEASQGCAILLSEMLGLDSASNLALLVCLCCMLAFMLRWIVIFTLLSQVYAKFLFVFVFSLLSLSLKHLVDHPGSLNYIYALYLCVPSANLHYSRGAKCVHHTHVYLPK